jgi:hypothetical protein
VNRKIGDAMEDERKEKGLSEGLVMEDRLVLRMRAITYRSRIQPEPMGDIVLPLGTITDSELES